MTMDGREVEWQFDAVDLRPVLRWLTDPEGWRVDPRSVRVAAAGTRNQVDLYLDTNDRRFQRAGYALRIRRSSSRREAAGEATLKALDQGGPEMPGLRHRREVSEQLAEPDLRALMRSEGPVGQRVRALAGRKRLLPLFEVRTHRRLFSLETDDSPPGEITLDETAIQPSRGRGGPPARLRRVEVEVPEGAVPPLEPFVEGLRAGSGLRPAGLSKYEAGMLSAGLRAPQPRSFGETTIDADTPIGTVAVAVLRRHFAALLAKEPGTRLGDDTEQLHDMRVASRRLRAALSLFADFLPAGADHMREELGWLGRALGAVRDLDVQLEQLDVWVGEVSDEDREPLDALRAVLEEQRAVARAAMLEALDSRRYEAFVKDFARYLRGPRPRSSSAGRVPARAVAPDLIEKRFERLRKSAERIGPDSEPADYHHVRIRGKRLRYALEFLSDVYPGRTEPLLKRLVALQDVLGLHQDADVAITRLRRLAGDRGDELRPTTVFAMGEIAERHRTRAAELRAQFPAVYKRVKGNKWKSLRKVLEDERPAPPPPAADAPAESTDAATAPIDT
jgi:CHAD domain-containing protein